MDKAGNCSDGYPNQKVIDSNVILTKLFVINYNLNFLSIVMYITTCIVLIWDRAVPWALSASSVCPVLLINNQVLYKKDKNCGRK